MQIPLDQLHVYRTTDGRPFNPRTDQDTTDLQACLREIGQIEPISVCPRWDAAEGYYLISGHRRKTAAAALGWAALETFVRTDIDSRTIEAAILAGNAAEPPDPLRVAQALARLLSQGKTEATCARLLAIPIPHIRTYMQLLAAPETVKQRIRSGQITFSALRALLAAPQEIQEQVAGGNGNGNGAKLTTDAVRREVRKARAEAAPHLLDDEAVVQQVNGAVGVLEDLTLRYAGGLPPNIAWRVATQMQRARRALNNLLTEEPCPSS